MELTLRWAWINRFSGSTFSVYGMAHRPGRLVVVGDSGRTMTSSNGHDWLEGPRPFFSIADVIFGHVFVIVGKGFTGEIWYPVVGTSLDGRMWDSRAFSGVNQGFTSVAYRSGVYVVVGDRQVLTSTDAQNWTILSQTNPPLKSVALGPDRYVACGAYGTILSPQPVNSGTTQTLNDVVWSERGYVIVGDGGTILTSADGIAWSSQISGIQTSLRKVAVGGGVHVAVGDEGVILTSFDSTNWVRRLSGTKNALYAVTFDGDSFLVGGEGGTILQSEPLPILKLRFSSPGELTWSGIIGARYQIQRTSNLSAPWETVAIVNLTENPFTWVDDRPLSHCFYRLILGP